MARVPGVLLGVALLTVAAPLSAQQASEPWVNQWFWGVQGGATRFKTPEGSASWETGYAFGAHWLITGRRMGLYMSYDQLLYDDARSIVTDPTTGVATNVQFDNGRYFQADLLAIPLKGSFQPMVGVGLTIHHISDAVAANAAAQDLVDVASSRAFFNIMGGVQMMLGRRAAVYINYQFVPSTSNFLLNAEQHVFGGGLRYSFGSRKEDVTTGR